MTLVVKLLAMCVLAAGIGAAIGYVVAVVDAREKRRYADAASPGFRKAMREMCEAARRLDRTGISADQTSAEVAGRGGEQTDGVNVTRQ